VAATNNLTIPAAFERVARLYPNYEAAVDGVSRLTFGQVDDASRRLVTLLREQGVSPGDRVALLTLPSTAHMVSWLAIVRLGALPVALHTRESAPLLARLIGKFKSNVVLYDDSLTDLFDATAELCSSPLRGVALQSGAGSPGTSGQPGLQVPRDLSGFEPAHDLPVPAEDDAAVIVLSSGTTSLPKGVLHSHKGLIEAARSTFAMYRDLRPGSRIVIPYSTAFTGFYATFLPFLNAGGCCVFQEKFDLERYQSLIKAEKITHMSLAPTMWRKLLTIDSNPKSYATVVQAQFAAEPMDSTTLNRVRETVSPHIAQAYGSTETCGFLTIHTVEDMTEDRLVSVGRPFPNAEVRIVQMDGTPNDVVPTGELGVVMATSPSVALGIWEDEEMTERLFVTDENGLRWWRSSDMGRLDGDGFLFLEGRSDDMIISGGINIMPAAIEEVLFRHPAVIEAAVVGSPHPEWGQQVQAFVVAADPSLTEDDLKRFMADSDLSRYQQPREFHFVESLPKTATNKLNRRALRQGV
jgi:long-chain acyl-CoA synthetase